MMSPEKLVVQIELHQALRKLFYPWRAGEKFH